MTIPSPPPGVGTASVLSVGDGGSFELARTARPGPPRVVRCGSKPSFRRTLRRVSSDDSGNAGYVSWGTIVSEKADKQECVVQSRHWQA
jgi:hypothetical protein